MKIIILSSLCFCALIISCSTSDQNAKERDAYLLDSLAFNEQLIAILDTVFQNEQQPIRKRDSLMEVLGVESEEAQVYQELYRKNHSINIKRITALLDSAGWPNKDVIGIQGNRTICNVLQHSDNETRQKYLPMMRKEVLKENLDASWLVRAEDRLATDRGDLQIYGGQMKYYPETQSFNVWPIYDPANINKRRAEIGLGTIEEHLQNNFDFEWDLEEQIKRTQEFIKTKEKPLN